MDDYIKREDFISDKRKQYCFDCNRRKGYRNGKVKFCYEIGGAPCRACDIDDLIDDVEDYPAADVRENIRGEWQPWKVAFHVTCSECGCNVRASYGSIFEGIGELNFCPNCGADMRGKNDAK